jgi:hypothetical protein
MASKEFCIMSALPQPGQYRHSQLACSCRNERLIATTPSVAVSDGGCGVTFLTRERGSWMAEQHGALYNQEFGWDLAVIDSASEIVMDMRCIVILRLNGAGSSSG